MTKALWHALICSVAGALLSAAVVAAYRLAADDDFASSHVALMLLLGAVSAGGAGGVISLVQRRQTRSATEEAPTAIITGLEHDAFPIRTLKSAPADFKGQRTRRTHLLAACLDPSFRWQKVSGPLCELLRRSRAELQNEPFFSVLHPEDLPAVDQALQAAQSSSHPQTVECRLLAKQRTRAGARRTSTLGSDTQLLPPLRPEAFVHVRLRVAAQRKGNKVLGLRCRCKDLTLSVHQKKLKRSQSELVATRQILRRLKKSYFELYQNAPVMYFRLDLDGKFIGFNDTLIRTLGYRRDELAGHSYFDLLSEAGNRAADRAQPPFREGELQTRWRRKDGTLIDVLLRAEAILGESGNFERSRCSALDLTEKNQLAQELRTRGDELERTNNRLRHINSELEDFTHVVSHDLKEPLRTLQTYSHILAQDHSTQLGPDGFQYINHLIQASRRLGLLIDDLLHLSQAGRNTRAPQVFNLIEVIATVRQDLVDLIQRKEASVLTEGSLPAVKGDPLRIAQLLTNLVANGLKYNQNAQPKVVIGAQSAESAHQVTVFVRDNGIGIDPAFHKQIFGIFRRLHQPEDYEGTGAGLAICKKIVEAHGGQIWVESQPGLGSTFFFTLPRPSATSQPTPIRDLVSRAPAKKPVPAPRPRTRQNGRETTRVDPAEEPHLVVVEDNIELGTVIQKLGKKSGQRITWFTTAEEAWEFLQTARPDFLLFDIELPGMSGTELCRRVRSLTNFANTPIALYSSEVTPERFKRFHEAGADYILSKDLLCQPALWQKKLQELLDRGRR